MKEKIPRDNKIIEPPENKKAPEPKKPQPVKCQWCGCKVPVPAGTCFTCPNCFRQSGGC